MTGHGGNDRRDKRARNADFVRDVMSRTSGSPCDRACEQLADLMAGDLAGMDRELVQAHLEHCDPCRAVAVTLGWLEPLLPAMAEIDPGPGFTAQVLSRTTGRRAPVRADVPAVPTGAAGLMDRVGRWWDRQILRPGFAAQVAYAATVVLVLLTAVPGAPLRQVPGQALEIVQAGPTATPLIGPALDEFSGWVGHRADAATAGARTSIRQRWQGVEDSLSRRGGRTATGRQDLRTHLKEMASQLGDGQVGEASYEFLAVLKAGQVVWIEWWNDNADNGQE